jgi:hypothetical protein
MKRNWVAIAFGLVVSLSRPSAVLLPPSQQERKA